jgi:hypothetical protein
MEVCNVCDYYPCQCEQIKVIKAEQKQEEKRRKRKARNIKRAKKMAVPVYGVSSKQTLSIKRKTLADPICVASSEPTFPTDRFPNKLKDSYVATREFIIETESSKKKCKL